MLHISTMQKHHGLNSSHNLPNPTEYVEAMLGEFSEWAYCEDTSTEQKGLWRSNAFKVKENHALDVEIGTGNGYFFAHQAKSNPNRNLVGFEIKYKPLVQSIRRARKAGCENVRICRYSAGLINQVFANGEINNVYIHHPDPWPKKRDWKKRLIQEDFLINLETLQRPDSFVEFKTDDQGYFDWAVERFKKSPYQLAELTYDLHNSEFANKNFVTTFEKIFISRGQPIFYAKLFKK